MSDVVMGDPDLEGQLSPESLRELYVNSTLNQRYRVALERRRNPDHGPNVLVNAVAALEGFTRAAVIQDLIGAGKTTQEAYACTRWLNPSDLLKDFLLPSLDISGEEAFGRESWERLALAMQFRNLLVHEATYLHGGTCRVLVDTVDEVFDAVAVLCRAKRGEGY